MLQRLIEISKRPKRAPTRMSLLWGFAFQAVLLVIIMMVVIFWPERAYAVSSLIFLCFGFAAALWLEAYEHRIGVNEPGVNPIRVDGSHEKI